jgi:hypothetical protein
MQQFHNVANFPLIHKYVGGQRGRLAQGRASAPTATG